MQVTYELRDRLVSIKHDIRNLSPCFNHYCTTDDGSNENNAIKHGDEKLGGENAIEDDQRDDDDDDDSSEDSETDESYYESDIDWLQGVADILMTMILGVKMTEYRH